MTESPVMRAGGKEKTMLPKHEINEL